MRFFHWLIRRPLSALSAGLAGVLILAPIYQGIRGNIYLERLDYIDGTTLIMVGILLLRGLWSLRFDSDLQAVAVALTGALSFVFAFEAIFKLSFYIFPWRMPPEELRAFIIQVGVALTVLVGFAFGRFHLSRLSVIFIGVFLAGWLFWLFVGFPQLKNGQNFYPQTIAINLTWDMLYVLNRIEKAALGLVYFFFYRPRPDNQRSQGKNPAFTH